MGEYLGPLDIVRDINDGAVALEQCLQSSEDFSSEEQEAMSSWRLELDERHPLMRQQVTISGSVLQTSIDDDGKPQAYTQRYSDEKSWTNVKGTYYGLEVRNVYDADKDEEIVHVFHAVITSETGAYWDDWGDQVDNKKNISYVRVMGAKITPILPKFAHSFQDLKNETVTSFIDGLAFNEDLNPMEKVDSIAKLMNRSLVEHADRPILNHQIISYINSLGLFDKYELVSADYAHAPSLEAYQIGSAEGTTYSNFSTSASVPVHLLTALPCHYRSKRSGVVHPGIVPGLCSITQLEDSGLMIMPLATIEGMRAL